MSDVSAKRAAGPPPAQRRLMKKFEPELKQSEWAEQLAQLNREVAQAGLAIEKRIDEHYKTRYCSDRHQSRS